MKISHVIHFGYGFGGKTLGGAATLSDVSYRVHEATTEGEVMRGAIKQRLQWCLDSDRKANDTPLWRRNPLFRSWDEARLRAPQGEWKRIGGEVYAEPYGPRIDHPLFSRRARIRYRDRLRWKWA